MSKNSFSLNTTEKVSHAQKIPQSHILPGRKQHGTKWKEISSRGFTSRALINPGTQPSTKGNSIESNNGIKKRELLKQPYEQKPNINIFNGYSTFVKEKKESMLVEENWDCEELEEGKEATAGTVKVYALNSGLSSRKFGEFTMSARFSSTNEFEHKGNLRNFVYDGDEDKCKCPRDKFKPYCKRTKEWINILYEKKGIRFEHAKYKIKYEVTLSFNANSKYLIQT